MRKHILLASIALLSFAGGGFAQQQFHVFPQFADGRLGDGSYYRSTLMVLPWFSGDGPTCSFVLYGMTATFETGGSGYSFNTSVPAGTALAARTAGTQPLQSGYATLACDEVVFANIIYSYFAPNGTKLAEATVFSATEYTRTSMVFDVRDGARHAIAIANNTNFTRVYIVTLAAGGVTRSAFVIVPARRNLARFVDELMTVPPNALGILTVYSNDYSFFSMVGLRYTGPVFTTIPAGN